MVTDIYNTLKWVVKHVLSVVKWFNCSFEVTMYLINLVTKLNLEKKCTRKIMSLAILWMRDGGTGGWRVWELGGRVVGTQEKGRQKLGKKGVENGWFELSPNFACFVIQSGVLINTLLILLKSANPHHPGVLATPETLGRLSTSIQRFDFWDRR